jgi:hypothetical protein
MNGVIENLHGTTNDDMVSLTTIDELHAEVTKGHIENVDIRNISAQNGYSGVRLLSAGDYDIRCVRISGVYGDYRHNAVLISQHNTRPNTRTWFDDITVEHIHAHKCGTPLDESCFCYWEENAIEKLPVVWIETGIDAGSITLRDISRHETTDTEGYLVQIDKGARIRRLLAENIWQTCAEGVSAPLWFCEAEIDRLIERDIDR